MTKVISLEATNFAGLRAVEIGADGRPVVVIAGNNEQGKSSVLDAIVSALSGAKYDPKAAIHRGADKGSTVLTLSNGWTVEVLYRNGKPRRLKCRTADGKAISQTELTARLSQLMNPLDFARGDRPEDHRRRAEMLREIVGLDLDSLDRAIATAEAERLHAGRERDRERAAWEQMGPIEDAPSEPIDVPALTAELADVTAQEAAIYRVEQDAKIARDRAATHRRLASDAREKAARLTADADPSEEIARINAAEELARVDAADRLNEAINAAKREHQRQIEAIRAATDEAVARAMDAAMKAERDAATASDDVVSNDDFAAEQDARAARAETKAAAMREALPDAEAIRKRINDAGAINAKIEANNRRRAARERYEAKQRAWIERDAAVHAARDARTNAIASCKMPLDGLGFGADGMVTWNGLPFAAASRSRKIRIGFALALAGEPEIRVLCIYDGSDLDERAMTEIHALAVEHDAQVFIERVMTTDEGAFVIEDGTNA